MKSCTNNFGGTKLSGEVSLGVRGGKRLNTTGLDGRGLIPYCSRATSWAHPSSVFEDKTVGERSFLFASRFRDIRSEGKWKWCKHFLWLGSLQFCSLHWLSCPCTHCYETNDTTDTFHGANNDVSVCLFNYALYRAYLHNRNNLSDGCYGQVCHMVAASGKKSANLISSSYKVEVRTNIYIYTYKVEVILGR
jgi:hypothetical protein